MNNVDLCQQIAEAIYVERADNMSKIHDRPTVARVVLDMPTYATFLHNLQHRSVYHQWRVREGEPTEVYVLGVPVIARKDAEPGFTLEIAKVRKFRA